MPKAKPFGTTFLFRKGYYTGSYLLQKVRNKSQVFFSRRTQWNFDISM